MFNRYIPHVKHQFIPFIIVFLGAGIAEIFKDWIGILTFLVCIVIGLVASVQIAWVNKLREDIELEEAIRDKIDKFNNSDPTTLEALGLISPPQVTRIEQVSSGKDNPYYSIRYDEIKVPPAVLQVFANGILSGRKTLSETQWTGVITKYRKFQDTLLHLELITPVNPLATTQGYVLTEKGETWLLQYASPGVQAMVAVRKAAVVAIANNPPT